MITLFALIASTTWIFLAALSFWRWKDLESLVDIQNPEPTKWPLVSILVPARDEEEGFEKACRSLLALDYPNLEFILINDRSSDKTGEMMKQMAARDARIKVVEIASLAPGWMGKTHALQRGLEKAQGEWLMFTDADVNFEPSSVKRAMSYCQARDRDYLSLMVEMTIESPWVAPFGLFGFMMLALYCPFKDVERPDRSAYMGVGGFQLIRRKALDESPGLEWLRMEPVDDMGVSLLLKTSGKKISVLGGRELVRVAWYPTLASLFRGAGSRSFVFANYRYDVLFFRGVFITASWLLPLWLIFQGTPWLWVGLAAFFIPPMIVAPAAKRVMGMSMKYAPLFPLGPVLLTACVIYSLLRTPLAGGMIWRGRVYPLADLRAGQRVKT